METFSFSREKESFIVAHDADPTGKSINRFIISDDGYVADEAARHVASMFREITPWADPLGIEANAMVVQTYADLTALIIPTWAEFGLSDGRFSVLRCLYQAEGRRLAMSDLARLMNVTPTNVTKLVNGLRREDLVRKLSDPSDRRVVRVELTAEGAALFESVLPHIRAKLGEAWDGLSESEKRLLIHLLAKLRMHVLARPRVEGAVSPEGSSLDRSPTGHGTP